jgi:glycosyltransferase involved in cell wall biosynthesis
MTKIALVTPAHLSANPRLIKEADALAEAGYEVTVFACQYIDWPLAGDVAILKRSKWRAFLLRWADKESPFVFWFSRLRQHLCKHAYRFANSYLNQALREQLAIRAFDRVLPELCAQVRRFKADIYIGHNLQALPIVVAAARGNKALVGFDAEDFHSGMFSSKSVNSIIVDFFEHQYFPECDYLTTASPGIATAYQSKFGRTIPIPTPILNVFPLAQRPDTFRPGKPAGPLTLYWFSQTIGASRGLEDVVQAMGLLPDLNIELHLRGQWQPGYQERVRLTAAAAGVRQAQIISYPPALPDEMARLASIFDVGLAVEPGRDLNNQITVSNKLFTYLLAGNAIIATDTPGQRMVMAEINDAGFCYTPGDVAALAQQMRCWYEDRQALQQARLAAWRWGNGRFNWDVEKERFLELIDTVMAAGSGSVIGEQS